jgi:hypothetical protein
MELNYKGGKPKPCSMETLENPVSEIKPQLWKYHPHFFNDSNRLIRKLIYEGWLQRKHSTITRVAI